MCILDFEELMILFMHSNGILEITKMSQKLVSDVSKQIIEMSAFCIRAIKTVTKI